MRKTVQQQIILKTLKLIDKHPTVDELYLEIQKEHPVISKATIYRNIKRLTGTGEVKRIPGDAARYDISAGCHSHFICEMCGVVMDVAHEVDRECDTEALEANGYDINRREFYLYGTCPGCKKKA